MKQSEEIVAIVLLLLAMLAVAFLFDGPTDEESREYAVRVLKHWEKMGGNFP